MVDSVDDLASIDDLERHVEESQAMLILLGSTKYMSSPNCQREVAAAKRCGLPLVRVHDADSAKGGAPLTELRRMADSHRFSRQHTGLLLDAAAEEIVPWHRVAAFQLNALAAIAERLILASPAYASEAAAPLYVKGALAWVEASFVQPVTLYASPHNPAAAETARELSELLPGLQLVSSREGAASWLLFLSPTCFEEESGARLAAEVAAAVQAGVAPVMLWSPAEGDFGEIIERTPRALVAAGLYGPLAIEWRAGVHRAVSVRLAAMALGAQVGGGGGWRASVAGAAAGVWRVASRRLSGRARVVVEEQGRAQDGDVMLLTVQQQGTGRHAKH